MLRTKLLALILLAAFASAVSAAPILYGINGTQLITINTSTGEGTLVGTGSYGNFPFGLADYGGNLYSFNQTLDQVQQLSPTNGSVLSSVGIGRNLTGEGAIAFNSSGTLFLAANSGSNGNLYSTTLNGSSTLVGTLPSMDGLDFASDGTLYGIGQTPDLRLYTIDPATGASTLVGATGMAVSTSGLLGFAIRADGAMFAVHSDVLFSINPMNGVATRIGNVGFTNISGLSFLDTDAGAIPEPSTWAPDGLWSGFVGAPPIPACVIGNARVLSLLLSKTWG